MRTNRQYLVSFGDKQRGHVGEVILAVRIISAQAVDVREERLGVEGIESRIDLADVRLLRTQGLLLDDCGHAICSPFAQDASVARGVGWLSGEDGHCGTVRGVKVADAADRLRTDQGRVSGEDKKIGELRQGGARRLDGVAGTTLLGLHDEVDSCVSDGSAHALGFVSDDDVDVLRRHDCRRRTDHMCQQRFSADFMEYFGALRLQSRAFSRCHNSDRKVLG